MQVLPRYDPFYLQLVESLNTLPSKTVPEVKNKKKQTHALKLKTVSRTAAVLLKKKARACSVEVEEIENEDSACNIAVRNSGISPTSSFQMPDIKQVTCVSHCRCFYLIGVFREAPRET